MEMCDQRFNVTENLQKELSEDCQGADGKRIEWVQDLLTGCGCM
jgi:hypothetical protein